MTWKVGDKVWIVHNDSRMGKPIEAEILKVGRLYAELSGYGYRMRLDSGYVTSRDFHIGHAWRSLEEYEEAKRLDALWTDFTRRIVYKRPAHITADDIKRIMSIVAGKQPKELDDAAVIGFWCKFEDPEDVGFGKETRATIRALRAALTGKERI